MTASLPKDANSVAVIGGVSDLDGVSILPGIINHTTGRLKVSGVIAGGTGTVSSVSVVSANGFAGTVATATTTPAITLSTTITGILQGNGTAISAATTTGSGGIVLVSSPTIATPTISGHFTAEGVTTTGATGTGALVFGTAPTITLASASTAVTQSTGDNTTAVATDAFVTTAIANAIAGVNPAVAVQCATTQSSDTSGLTYIHVAGIGDTFTGTINTAIVIDGHTLILGDRVLIKNDTQTSPGSVSAGTFNGIYLVTQIQTIAVAPILTRALDYDTPSDINNTGAIPVVLGTVNATTSWLLTSSITAVGTGSNALTYAQFSYAPSAIPTLAGNNTFTGQDTFKQVIYSNNAITASGNAATVPVTSRVNTVTNNSAATLTVTFTTSGAVDRQLVEVLILDATGVAQTITWVNTENSNISVPTTSNGSTTLPLSVLFQYNNATSKWRCLASV